MRWEDAQVCIAVWNPDCRRRRMPKALIRGTLLGECQMAYSSKWNRDMLRFLENFLDFAFSSKSA